MKNVPQKSAYLAGAICAIAIVVFCWQDSKGSGQDTKRSSFIDGTWTEVFRERTGDDFPTIDAERILMTTVNQGGPPRKWKPHVWKFSKEILEEGRGIKDAPIVSHLYELDVGSNAGNIDFLRVEKDLTKEKRKLGIYWHADDFLLIAWNPPGDERPKSLMTQPKSKTTMVILRRGIIK